MAVRAGHWQLGHTAKNLVVVQAQMLFNFALFAAVRNAASLFSSFGFTKDKPAFIAYTLFSIISAPLSEVPQLQASLGSCTSRTLSCLPLVKWSAQLSMNMLYIMT